MRSYFEEWDEEERKPKKSHDKLILVLIIIGIVLVLAGLIFWFVKLYKSDDELLHFFTKPKTTETVPQTTKETEEISTGIDDVDISRVETEEESRTEKPEETEKETETVEETGEHFMSAKQFPEETALIKRYFLAMQNGNSTILKTLVTDRDALAYALQNSEARSKIIEEYSEITCYFLDGPEENSLLAYVYCNVHFYNVATPAPFLSRFLLVDREGIPYIDNGPLSEKKRLYIEEMAKSSLVKTLSDLVSEAMAKACREDEKLAKLMEIMNYEPTEPETLDPDSTEHQNVTLPVAETGTEEESVSEGETDESGDEVTETAEQAGEEATDLVEDSTQQEEAGPDAEPFEESTASESLS